MHEDKELDLSYMLDDGLLIQKFLMHREYYLDGTQDNLLVDESINPHFYTMQKMVFSLNANEKVVHFNKKFFPFT